MSEKKPKAVLTVDDDVAARDLLKWAFEEIDSPYEFLVDEAGNYPEAVAKIRAKKDYDVIVLDVEMGDPKAGLQLNFHLALQAQFGTQEPIRIVFTGAAKDIPSCVEAMRRGAWDFILKDNFGDIQAQDLVVNSAVNRLRQLDLGREQEQRIVKLWLPAHLHELEEHYGGQIIALWHEPEVTVVASGKDTFEIEDRLKEWRAQHSNRPWEQPYLVQIPAVPYDYQKV